MAVTVVKRNETLIDKLGRPTLRFSKFLENTTTVVNNSQAITEQQITEITTSIQRSLATSQEIDSRVDNIESLITNSIANSHKISEIELSIEDIGSLITNSIRANHRIAELEARIRDLEELQ